MHNKAIPCPELDGHPCPDNGTLYWYEPWQLWICDSWKVMEGGCTWLPEDKQPPPPNYLQRVGMGL